MKLADDQRKARAGLVEERKREPGPLAPLQTDRAGVAAKGRQIETESAPIRYVAELLGVDTDSERAIRWLIALMVLCCDPLAIALTAAALTSAVALTCSTGPTTVLRCHAAWSFEAT